MWSEIARGCIINKPRANPMNIKTNTFRFFHFYLLLYAIGAIAFDTCGLITTSSYPEGLSSFVQIPHRLSRPGRIDLSGLP